MNIASNRSIIEHFCLREDLSTYDPYDIWKTRIGISIKELYNSNKYLGLIPAGILTLIDLFCNNLLRSIYKKQEFPIVRAIAAQTLLKLYSSTKKTNYLEFSKKHIDWLVDNHSMGYSGLCWGLGFKWPAGKKLIYNSNTPFTTHTPYVLEAIHKYIIQTNDSLYIEYIKSIYDYYEKDVEIIYEDENSIGISYGPMKDRLITNAVSYTLYAYCIFLNYIKKDEIQILEKINKLYNFIKKQQLSNGAWIYEPFSDKSFIDCFHSCFILKNIFKANEIIPLPDSQEIISKGYQYIKKNFYNEKLGLVKRFSISNKPSLIKFDLYDNAEFLNLSVLYKDDLISKKMNKSIREHFLINDDVYSVIDLFNVKRNKNTLRWAVMPYLFALSNLKND